MKSNWRVGNDLNCGDCLIEKAAIVKVKDCPGHIKSYRPLPQEIDGVPVQASGRALKVKGEVWQTMIAEDEFDDRIWEFSLTTGRIIRTRG